MHTQSISALEGNGLPPVTRPKSRVSWAFAVISCLYYFLAYGTLARAVPIFGKLFPGLGVPLPLLTRLLMASYSWLFPVLCIGAVILTIARQFVQLGKLQLRIVNLMHVVIGIIFPSLVIIVLYLPLFDLIRKLSLAH